MGDDGVNGGLYSSLDTFFQDHWVCTGSDVLHAFAYQSLCKQSSGCSAVACCIVCFGSNFFYQLCAHVFKWVFQLDLFCDGNTVIGDQRCTEFFVQNDVASLWTQGDFYGISQLIDAVARGDGAALVGELFELAVEHHDLAVLVQQRIVLVTRDYAAAG